MTILCFNKKKNNKINILCIYKFISNKMDSGTLALLIVLIIIIIIYFKWDYFRNLMSQTKIPITDTLWPYYSGYPYYDLYPYYDVYPYGRWRGRGRRPRRFGRRRRR